MELGERTVCQIFVSVCDPISEILPYFLYLWHLYKEKRDAAVTKIERHKRHVLIKNNKVLIIPVSKKHVDLFFVCVPIGGICHHFLP